MSCLREDDAYILATTNIYELRERGEVLYDLNFGGISEVDPIVRSFSGRTTPVLLVLSATSHTEVIVVGYQIGEKVVLYHLHGSAG
jgi:hypothetical protein